MHEIKCPIVVSVYIDIIRKIQAHTSNFIKIFFIIKIIIIAEENEILFKEDLKTVYNFAFQVLKENFEQSKNLRYDPDLGHSILRKNLIKFCIGIHFLF